VISLWNTIQFNRITSKCYRALCPQIPNLLWCLTVAMGGLFALPAVAQSLKLPVRETYPAVRAHGMGGAFSPVADDGDAIFLNPAGIGREDGEDSKSLLRGAQFPNISFGFNKFTQDTYKTYAISQEIEAKELEKSVLTAEAKSVLYGRTTIFPYFTLGRVQFGFLFDSETQGYLSNYDSPQTSEFSTDEEPRTYDSKLSFSSINQVGGVLGFSVPYRKTGFSLGASARYMVRASLRRDIEASEGVALKVPESASQEINKTKGLAVDAGILWEFSKKLAPTLAVSLRDVAGTLYKAIDSKSSSEIERMNVVTGVSMRPFRNKYLGTLLSLEGQRMDDERVSGKEKIRLGAELTIGANDSTAPASLRAGYNFRGVSYGASVELLFFQLEASSFVESVEGEQGTRLDRRNFVRMSVDLRI
jgi:hypothetical protein